MIVLVALVHAITWHEPVSTDPIRRADGAFVFLGPPTPSPWQSFLSKVPPDPLSNQVCEGIGLEATLRGSPDDPRVVWLEGEPGHFWRPGWVAKFEPKLKLYDDAGNLVAVDGSVVSGGECVNQPDSRHFGSMFEPDPRVPELPNDVRLKNAGITTVYPYWRNFWEVGFAIVVLELVALASLVRFASEGSARGRRHRSGEPP